MSKELLVKDSCYFKAICPVKMILIFKHFYFRFVKIRG